MNQLFLGIASEKGNGNANVWKKKIISLFSCLRWFLTIFLLFSSQISCDVVNISYTYMCNIFSVRLNSIWLGTCAHMHQALNQKRTFWPAEGSNMPRREIRNTYDEEEEFVHSLCIFLLLHLRLYYLFTFFFITKWTYIVFSKQYFCSSTFWGICIKDNFTPTRTTWSGPVSTWSLFRIRIRINDDISFWIGSENSKWCVYMKHFDSDQAFITTICIHVNIDIHCIHMHITLWLRSIFWWRQ